MDAIEFPRGMLLLAYFGNGMDPTPIFEPLKGKLLTRGFPICPKDCIGSEIFPAT